MPRRIKGPDGIIRQFPDDASDQEIAAAVASTTPSTFERVAFPHGPQAPITEGPTEPDWKTRLGQALEPFARPPESLADVGHLLLVSGSVTVPEGALRTIANVAKAGQTTAGRAVGAIGRGMERAGRELRPAGRYIGGWEMMTHPKKGLTVMAAPPLLQATGKVLQRIGAWAAGLPEGASLALSDADRALLVKQGYQAADIAKVEAAAMKGATPPVTPRTLPSAGPATRPPAVVDEAGRVLGPPTAATPPAVRPPGPWDANTPSPAILARRGANLREVFPEGTTAPTRGPAAPPSAMPTPDVPLGPAQPFTGPPLAQMWAATGQAGVKLNALDMQAGAKLVAKGANPADVVQQFLKLRGLLKSQSIQGLPSTAEQEAAVAARNARK